MSACEACWDYARASGVEYSEILRLAEREHWPCTQNTPEGAKLRAGHWWDDAKQADRRLPHVAAVTP